MNNDTRETVSMQLDRGVTAATPRIWTDTGQPTQLMIALTSNPRTWPVIDGSARPPGVGLEPVVLFPSELFHRQLKHAEFDIAEMSLSSFIIATSRGDDRFIGLPVFTSRHFYHVLALVRKDAGIDGPRDLVGKRVGVPEYQQTAAVWSRGILQHEFGVKPEDLDWWMERNPDESHGAATGFSPPPGVAISQIPYEESIGSMMLSGKLDAALIYINDANAVDRSQEDLWNHPDIRPLFPDPGSEAVRYYRKTGIYPINHGMVMKRSLAERTPELAESILRTLVQANDIANARRMQHVDYHIETGLIPAGSRQALQSPLVQHGIKANRKVLECIAQYVCEQGLASRQVALEELFAPSTMSS